MKLMNLHWGQTLASKVPAQVKSKNSNKTLDGNDVDANQTTKRRRHKHQQLPWSRDWSNPLNNSSVTLNRTISKHAENHFLKKSRMLTDIMTPINKPESLKTVFVIGGIFLFLTIGITGAVAVFCRKKNAVFALQKSEQEDIDDVDYELDEFEESSTEFEYSDSDVPRACLSGSRNHLDVTYHNSPSHFPLVDDQCCHDFDNKPFQTTTNDTNWSKVNSQFEQYEPSSGKSYSTDDGCEEESGYYHQMLVTAVMEQNHPTTVTTTATDSENQDIDNFTSVSNMPAVNVTYHDSPPSYDSINCKQISNDTTENLNNNSSTLPKYSDNYVTDKPYDDMETVVYVDLPDYGDEKKIPLEDGANVVYVKIPQDKEFKPKIDTSKTNSAKYVCLPKSAGKHDSYFYESLNSHNDMEHNPCDVIDAGLKGKCCHVICKAHTRRIVHGCDDRRKPDNQRCVDSCNDVWQKRNSCSTAPDLDNKVSRDLCENERTINKRHKKFGQSASSTSNSYSEKKVSEGFRTKTNKYQRPKGKESIEIIIDPPSPTTPLRLNNLNTEMVEYKF